MPARAFDLYIAPLAARSLEGATLVLAAPETLRAFVAKRFGGLLDEIAGEVLGPDGAVRIVPLGDGPAPAAVLPTPQPPVQAADAEFNPKLTFEQFVIGDSNRFAHAAALAVAELPAQAYNPLFVYGPPGCGKTHLLHAIGNYVRAYGNGLTVRYVTAERFTSDFVAALHRKDLQRFKDRFREADVLLVDDVQFLQAKAKTEEEFFHTFNELHDTGRQLVLTCDRLPTDLEAVEDRLRARFEAGLVTDVRPPNLAVRLAVLRKRVQHDGVDIADAMALPALAERITDNLRTLEGALIRVVAFHSLTGRPVTPALVDEVLDGLYPRPPAAGEGRAGPVTVARIQDLTAEAFGVAREELLSRARTAELAWARQVAMYLAREHTGQSLPAIGRLFGGRNHTTVLHACRKAGERMASDREAYEVVRALTERLCMEG